MPKQILKLDQFHGGLNTNSDPRDIADNELSESTAIMIDELGKIRTMGAGGAHATVQDATSSAINNGYGLFQFSHDRTGGNLVTSDLSGTHTGGDSATVLIDSAAAFTSVLVGATVNNTTDGSSGTVVSVDSGTQLTVDDLTGGDSDTFDDSDNDAYTITDFPETGDDYLAFADTDTSANLAIYSRVADSWGVGIVDLGGTTGMEPCFYVVDGALRVSDGNFNNTNKWFGYVHSKLYQHTFGGTHTAGDSANVMTDSLAKFVVDELIGYTIKNVTDGSSGTITDNTSTTVTATLSVGAGGGGDTSWDDANNDAYTITGVTKHLISKWVSTDQKLKSFDDMNISLRLDDCSAANPDTTSTRASNIIIGWWTSKGDDTSWNGRYFIGLAPVYIGGQEGPISVPDRDQALNPIDGSVMLSKEILNIQLFLCHATIGTETLSANESHLLGDDRIIGIKLYIRSYPSVEWFLLKDIDLIEGGKFAWADYESSSETAFGFWTDGSIAISSHSSLAEHAATTLTLTVTPGTAMGNNRKGLARITGFQSVIYKEVDLNSTSAQAFTSIDVINPEEGIRTFILEVLDENYGTLISDTYVPTITAVSGSTEPPEDGDTGFGGST
jgi:hypothetical protein